MDEIPEALRSQSNYHGDRSSWRGLPGLALGGLIGLGIDRLALRGFHCVIRLNLTLFLQPGSRPPLPPNPLLKLNQASLDPKPLKTFWDIYPMRKPLSQN